MSAQTAPQTKPGNTMSVEQLKRVSGAVASDVGVGTVKKFFDSQRSTLMAVLPKHMDADRMLKIALGALRTNPKLMKCRVDSLFGAVIQCAQLGLEPNTPLGHAYLIPFENKQKKCFEVQLIFGYKGLVDLCRRSGQIISIAAHEVRAKDKFDYEYGLDEKLVHKPATGDRGEITHFYAVAKFVGGGHYFEVLSREDVEAIRDNSSNYRGAKDKRETVWGKHFPEMGRKTCLRRIVKYLPISIEVAMAAALDGRAEVGMAQALESVLEGEFAVLDPDDERMMQGDNADETETPPAAISQQDHGPTVDEIIALSRNGEHDLAADLMRSLSPEDQQTVNARLTQAAPPPQQNRATLQPRTPEPQDNTPPETSTRTTRPRRNIE